MPRFISKMDLTPYYTDEEACLQLLFDEGLLRTTKRCPECNAVLYPYKRPERTYPEFRCRTGHGMVRESVTKGTWFERSHLLPIQVLLLVHCFAYKQSYDVAKMECSLGEKSMSSRTVTDWFNYCREVCMVAMDTKYAARGKIGGIGHVVQIDECKIRQRRYLHGRIVEGNWILAMIDVETNEVRMTICPASKRDADTLYNLIAEQVELTSTIHTNAWGGYYGLMTGGFAAHLAKNHSVHFIDPLNKVDTNHIESRWRTLRLRLSRGGIRRENLDMHICEYLWHTDCKNRSADPFQELIEDIRQAYPVD